MTETKGSAVIDRAVTEVKLMDKAAASRVLADGTIQLYDGGYKNAPAWAQNQMLDAQLGPVSQEVATPKVVESNPQEEGRVARVLSAMPMGRLAASLALVGALGFAQEARAADDPDTVDISRGKEFTVPQGKFCTAVGDTNARNLRTGQEVPLKEVPNRGVELAIIELASPDPTVVFTKEWQNGKVNCKSNAGDQRDYINIQKSVAQSKGNCLNKEGCLDYYSATYRGVDLGIKAEFVNSTGLQFGQKIDRTIEIMLDTEGGDPNQVVLDWCLIMSKNAQPLLSNGQVDTNWTVDGRDQLIMTHADAKWFLEGKTDIVCSPDMEFLNKKRSEAAQHAMDDKKVPVFREFYGPRASLERTIAGINASQDAWVKRIAA